MYASLVHVAAVPIFLLTLIHVTHSIRVKHPTPPVVCSNLLCAEYCALIKFKFGSCQKEKGKLVCKCKCSLANFCVSDTLCNKACGKKNQSGKCQKDSNGCPVCTCSSNCPTDSCSSSADCGSQAYCAAQSDIAGCSYKACKSCAAPACVSNSDCSGTTPICQTGSDANGCATGTCVSCPPSQCLSNSDCSGTGATCSIQKDPTTGCSVGTCYNCPVSTCTDTYRSTDCLRGFACTSTQPPQDLSDVCPSYLSCKCPSASDAHICANNIPCLDQSYGTICYTSPSCSYGTCGY